MIKNIPIFFEKTGSFIVKSVRKRKTIEAVKKTKEIENAKSDRTETLTSCFDLNSLFLKGL